MRITASTFISCLFLLASCASTPTPLKEPVATPTEQPTLTQAEEPNTPDPPEVLEEIPLLEDTNDLRYSISKWIHENEPDTYEEVAKVANKRMEKLGYPMVLNAANLISNEKVQLRSKHKIFVFESGKQLSKTTEVCGERFLRIPALIIGEEEASLVSAGKYYPLSLQLFQREPFKIYKDGSLHITLYAPEPTEPVGISNDGNALFLKFDLEPRLTEKWWNRISQEVPALLGEDPYLIVRLEKTQLRFDKALKNLIPQEFEVEEGEPGILRWKFIPTKFVLELSSRCEKS